MGGVVKEIDLHEYQLFLKWGDNWAKRDKTRLKRNKVNGEK